MATKLKKRKIPKAQRSRKRVSQEQQLATYIERQEAAEEKRIQAMLSKSFVLKMDFCIEDVRKRLMAFCVENGMDPAAKDKTVFFPESVVIEAYNQDNLIIALKMQQVTCKNWLIGVDTHLYNYDTEEVITVPYQILLDGMTYGEVTNGSKHAKLERKGGFKTRWQGLEKELNDHYAEYKDRDLRKFKIIRTQVRMAGECYFVNYKMYQEYLFMQGLRSEGVLIEALNQLTKVEVEKGKLDYQLQPISEGLTTIPTNAFAPLLKEQSAASFNLQKMIAG